MARFIISFLITFYSLHYSLHGFANDADHPHSCGKTLKGSEQSPQLSLAREVSSRAATEAEKALETRGIHGPTKRGYALLIGTMVGSAVLTSYLSAHLPKDFQFASIFIAQVSTLGVYVLGSPIWEPLSSKFRKWAFNLSNNRGPKNSSIKLESTWERTQKTYSVNAQMSRNVISQLILSVKENFYHAYQAINENQPIYAADQIAEAAYRLRILFKEVDPEDSSVAIAVSSTFTNHVVIDESFVKLVWRRLKEMDHEASTPEINHYYRLVLASWLREVPDDTEL